MEPWRIPTKNGLDSHKVTWHLSVTSDNTTIQLAREGQVPIRYQLWEKVTDDHGTFYLQNVGASESMHKAMVLQMNGVQGNLPAAALTEATADNVNVRWFEADLGEYIKFATANPAHQQYLNVYGNGPYDSKSVIGTHDGDGANARWRVIPYVPRSSLTWQDAIEFKFINEFSDGAIWDDGGTDAQRVSFWHPIVPAGYHMVGDFGHLGRANPSKRAVVVVVKELQEGALAEPEDFKQIWMDGRNRCSFWQPIPPDGYVAMGTVVTPGNSKPTRAQVMCVREDLVAVGEVGPRIWDDHDSGAPYPATIFGINASTAPEGVAHFSPNTFLTVSGRGSAPVVHDCAHVFKVSVAPQTANSSAPKHPTLTDYDKPSLFAEDTETHSCLLPWFVVKDEQYTAAEKLTYSPTYLLQRKDRYKLLVHINNRDGNERQSRISTESVGISDMHSRTWTETTGLKLTAATKSSAKVLDVGTEVSYSVEISQTFAWSETDSRTTTKTSTDAITLVVPAQSSGAVWTIESTYRLFRNAGAGTEVQIKDLNGGELTITDVRPNGAYYASYPSGRPVVVTGISVDTDR